MKLTHFIFSVLVCFASHSLAGNALADVGKAGIHSQQELHQHLQNLPQNESPLLYLSVPGRERFVESIIWTDSGIAGFSFFPLELELTEEQTYSILKLFGLEAFISSLRKFIPATANYAGKDAFLTEMYALHDLISAGDTGKEQSQAHALIDSIVQSHLDSIENLHKSQLHQLRYVLSAGLRSGVAQQYAGYYEKTLHADTIRPDPHHIEPLIHFFWMERDFTRLFSLADSFDLTDYVQRNYLIDEESSLLADDDQYQTMTLKDGVLSPVNNGSLFDKDFHVVVVSSPGCGFSRALYGDFEQAAKGDPKLAANFSWFISQDSSATPAQLFALKDTYPLIDFEIVAFNQEWSEHLDLSQYPLIYTVSAGEVRLAMTGWSAHNSRADLVDLIPAR